MTSVAGVALPPRCAMSRIFAIVTSVCVSLWLGGLIFLFISIQVLFIAFPKRTSDVAMQAAPQLFATFEKYQLILAAIALLATFGWYASTRTTIVMCLFILLALAAAIAALSTALITSRMEIIRRAGQSGSAAFARLHARSMIACVTEAALLLGAAIIIPIASGWRGAWRETARA